MQMQALKRGAEQRTSPGPAASAPKAPSLAFRFSNFFWGLLGGVPPTKQHENHFRKSFSRMERMGSGPTAFPRRLQVPQLGTNHTKSSPETRGRDSDHPTPTSIYHGWAAGTELASGNLPPSELTRRTGAVGETLSGCHGSADSARGAIPLATGRARQAHAIEAAERGAWHPKH